MKTLKVKRFKQDPSYCSIAASACLANFFDNTVDYEFVKTFVKNCEDGYDSPEIGLFLNKIGFSKVTIVSADENLYSPNWYKLSKHLLAEKLLHCSKKKSGSASALTAYKFLNNKNNNIIIDYDFRPYIMSMIDIGIPVMVNFNWDVYFRQEWVDGTTTYHASVINGYDDSGVSIVDSHYEYYKYSLKKYKNGRYKILWDHLLAVIGTHGDILVAEEYSKPRNK